MSQSQSWRLDLAGTSLALGFDEFVIGLAVLDAENRVSRLNSTLATWLGRPREDLLGARWEDLVLSIEPLYDPPRWEALRRGERVHFSCRRRLHQGGSDEAALLQVSCVPLLDATQQVTGQVLAQVQQCSVADAAARSEPVRGFTQDEDLAAAARYVTSLLPNGLESLWGLRVQSRYLPSLKLAGDCFDYFWLTDSRFAVYLLDVSGHGMASALQAVSLHNLIRSRSLDQQVLLDPAALLAELNGMFPIERQSNYFTMWYGVYDVTTRELVYASGGHPPALLMSPEAEGPLHCQRLATRSLGVGLMEGSRYCNASVQVNPGDRLMLYSDGLFEFFDAEGKLWSFDSLLTLLAAQPELGMDVYHLTDTMRRFAGTGSFSDDCSVVLVEFSEA